MLRLGLEDQTLDTDLDEAHGLLDVPLRALPAAAGLVDAAGLLGELPACAPATELSASRLMNAGASSLRMCSIIHCAEAESSALGQRLSSSRNAFSAAS